MQQYTGWYRYRDTSVSVNDTAPSRHSQTPPSNIIVTEGSNGIRLRFMGSASTAVTCQIWAIDRSFDHENPDTQLFSAVELSNIFGITIPAAANGLQGFGGRSIVRAGEYMCNIWVTAPALLATAGADWGLDFRSYVLGANNLTAGINQHDTVGVAGQFNEVMIGAIGGLYGLVLVFGGISSESVNAIFKLDHLIGR